MNITAEIVTIFIAIIFIMIIHYLKYKFPVFFLNFGEDKFPKGFLVNSKWYSKSSNEVKEYKNRQKRNLKKNIIFSVLVLIIFFAINRIMNV